MFWMTTRLHLRKMLGGAVLTTLGENMGCAPIQNQDGYDLGGNVTIIFEGVDFEDRTHRQIVNRTCPKDGKIDFKTTLDPSS